LFSVQTAEFSGRYLVESVLDEETAMLVQDPRIDRERLADLCERYGVARVEVFGSFAEGSAAPDSDVDLLVTFKPGSCVGLEFVSLQRELESLLGRSVDLLTRSSVDQSPNKYFRRFATRKTGPLYEHT
jgi:predicted nucleotidyltransferase